MAPDTAAPIATDEAARELAAKEARRRFFRLFTTVMLPMFLAAVDQTMLATATPVIGRELGGLRDTSWLAVSYLLAQVVTVPLYGHAGDQYGRRRCLVIAIGLFSLGSLGCGVAPTFGWLIASRVLQGLGGGGLMTLSQALVGEVVSPRQRARSQGYFAIVFTLASVGGPVFGGLVVNNASWRWLFLINLPLCAIAFWRLRSMLGEDEPHPHPGRADYAGLLLFALAMSLSLYWLSSGGHRFDWESTTSLAIVAAAAVSWVVLVRLEWRAERPFLPVDLLRLPAVRSAVLTVLGFASTMFAMVFYLPLYLQLALHSDAAEAGLLLLPLTAGIVSGAALTGRMIVWTGRPTAIPMVGLCWAAVCLLVLALAPPHKGILIGLGFGTGLGLGCVMSVMQIVTQTAAGTARLGSAAATMALSRSLGSSIGASAFGALIFGSFNSVEALRAAQTAASQAQVSEAFRHAFLAAAGICLLAAWAASSVPSLRFTNERPKAGRGRPPPEGSNESGTATFH